MPRMSQLSVSEVARQLGLRPSAIRYYERIGILPPAHRVSGQRRYDNTALHRRRGHTKSTANRLHFGGNSATVLRFSGWHSGLHAVAKAVTAKARGA